MADRRPYGPIIGSGAPVVTAPGAARSNFRMVDGVTAGCDCGADLV
jgi:hypothetical protein